VSVWRRARSLFPITGRAIHLDHAGRAPVSSRVEEAVRQLLEAGALGGGAEHEAALAHTREHVRARVAALVAAAPDEIAFVAHAARGLDQILADVDWRRGDACVLAGDVPEPTGWRRLTERGVVRLRVPSDAGAISLERVEEALRHPRARLLVCAGVDPDTGARAPVAAIARLCRERGVLACADASHQLGCLAVSAEDWDVDYLVSDAHRFALALGGIGILCRRRRVARNAAPARDAFEAGPANDVGVAALGAAVDLLLEWEPVAIERRILELTARLADGLRARGIRVSPDDAHRSGIAVFRVDGEAPQRTAARLRARRILVGDGDAGVRVSPHGYIEPAEIDALLDAV
jgi:selenocysteine lyase/cysteine desulfurase